MKGKTISKHVVFENSKRLTQKQEVETANGPLRLSPAQKAHMMSLNKLTEFSIENRKN